MEDGKYRFITRGDFDGIVSAMLMNHLELIGEIVFVHPKDMQDGTVDVTSNDITANVPYAPDVFMAFSHHISELSRMSKRAGFILDPNAPSAARVIYEYYGGSRIFPAHFKNILEFVDKVDSADLGLNDIMNPEGWILLGFIIDPRTGLGRFRIFEISNYNLMLELVQCIGRMGIEEILDLPHIKSRVDFYQDSRPKAEDQIKRCGKMYGNVLVIDLRDENTIWPINRFMPYALFPEAEVGIHLMRVKNRRSLSLSIGKSILNQGCECNIGNLLLRYKGGGLHSAAACQVDECDIDEVLPKIISCINNCEDQIPLKALPEFCLFF